MYIVFHCTQINRLAYLAAYLYLNPAYRVDLNQGLARADLLKLASAEKGNLYFISADSSNNRIFLLGSGKRKNIVIQALQGYKRIFSGKEEFVFFDLSRYENRLIRYSQILKAFNFAQTANSLMLKGIKKEFKKISRDIKEFKDSIAG